MNLRNQFSKSLVSLCAIVFLLIVSELVGFGQAPDGILGSVTDSSGASMPGVTVTATNPTTGERRSLATNQAGVYLFSSLQPGDYDVSAEKAGFKKAIKHATVETGRQVTVDFAMQVGAVNEAVEVSAAVSAINLVDSKVDSIIGQREADVPLNGRSAFELAKLVPGVMITTYIPNRDAETGISIIGRGAGNTAYSINGLNISDLSGGGEGLNVSHDAVREFQVSINNNDPSVGIGFAGAAVNLVTRSGSNDFHGDFSGYFRDGPYAAYPGLQRGILKPNPTNDPSIAAFNDTQTSPPFWRREYSGLLGGRLIKDRLFFVSSVDYTKQENSATFDPGSSDLQAFARIGSYPKWRYMQTHKVDWRQGDKNSFFLAYTRDDFETRASGVGSLPATWSSYERIKGSEGNSLSAFGWTAIWTPHFVSDVRVGLFLAVFSSFSVTESAQEAKQFAPNSGLAYLGAAQILSTNMFFGNEMNTPTASHSGRPQVVSNFTYVHGKHTLKFGGSLAPQYFTANFNSDIPYLVTLFNPTQARQAGIFLPTSFTTIGDLMQLPIDQLSIGAGRTLYPAAVAGHNILWSNQLYGYGGDSYKASPRLTLNMALSYIYDPQSAAGNRDLARPAILAPFFEGGYYGVPKIKKDMFSPSLGIAWDPKGDGKTVIRAGSGFYWGTGMPDKGMNERANLLPFGDGLEIIAGNSITNPLTGKGTLFFNTAGANAAAGTFRLSDLVNYIQAIRASLNNSFTGTNQDFSVTNYDHFKAATSAITDPINKPTYSSQSTLGVQHQVGADLLLEGNFLWNVSNNIPYTQDANLASRPMALGGPVIPGYSTTNISYTRGRANYRGLLLSAKKRMSHRLQASVSYTLSSNKDTQLVDYNNWKNNYGYDPTDRKQTLFANATMDLPWGFRATLVNDIQSSAPLVMTLTGVDLNGDGTTNDRLPGLSLNCLNISCSVGDLRDAVAAFNTKYAGTKDARGTTIQPVNLPANINPSNRIITQDFRLSKAIKFKERVNVNLVAECFNVFNISNVSFAAAGSLPAAGNLYSTGFGQATSRLGNFNSSEGPRAFQFGARVTF